MWTWILGVLGALLVFFYLVTAVFCWLLEAAFDGYFLGEGDGLNQRQRWDRIGSASILPLLLLGDFVKRMFLAAIGR